MAGFTLESQVVFQLDGLSNPDGTNYMIAISGVAVLSPMQTGMTEHYMAALNLVVPPGEFRHGYASGFPVGFSLIQAPPDPNQPPMPAQFAWHVSAADVDWDDETSSVQLSFDVTTNGSPGSDARVERVGFQAFVFGLKP